jgi:DNA replication protein DnaC
LTAINSLYRGYRLPRTTLARQGVNPATCFAAVGSTKDSTCSSTRPTGVGKTWIVRTLTHKACREGYKALYLRVPRLFEELKLAHDDGRYPKLMATFANIDLIVLADCCLVKLTAEQRRDLLELLDGHYTKRSTIVTSEIPVDHWHEINGDPTLADAILDRLVHNAYRINLKGGSMRKRYAKLTIKASSE